MGKLIKRIPGSHRFRQASLCQQAFSKPYLVNFISKDTNLVFSMYRRINRDTVESCKVEVLRTRGFISNYLSVVRIVIGR